MTVTANDLLVGPTVLASGVTTISLDFFVENEEDLAVYKSGVTTPLVLNTDYTFAGEGTDTGVVTLTTAANGTDQYAVYLFPVFERTTDLQLRGEFRSGPVNIELDRLWRSVQSLQTEIRRAFSLNHTSAPVDDIVATLAADRVNKTLVFSADGAALELGPTKGEIENALTYAERAETAWNNLSGDTVPQRLYYTPSMFGGTPGVEVDQAAAINACIAAAATDGRFVLFDGLYRTASTIEITTRGLMLFGADPYSCGLYPLTPTTDDLLLISVSGVRVRGLNLNSQGGGNALAVRGAPWADIQDCVFLDRDNAASGASAIFLSDQDKDGTFVAGSYAHTIKCNNMNQSPYRFDRCIETAGTSGGMNNCDIASNHMVADNDVIYIHAGGGNRIRGNYIKSRTGTHTPGTRVGKGVSASGSSQHVDGNYFESLQYCVFDRGGDSWFMGMNEVDNCDAVFGLSTGSKTPPLFGSQDGIHSLCLNDEGSYSLSGNGETIYPRSFLEVTGNGAVRTGCVLDDVTPRDGMVMVLSGESWPFELIESTTADFGAHASDGGGMWFGSTGSAVSGTGATVPTYEKAVFVFSNSKWRCVAAMAKAPTLGNAHNHFGAGNSETVATHAAVIRLSGNGAARTGNTLGVPVIDGQELTLIGGDGWGYTIDDSATVELDGGTNKQFGSGSGMVQAMKLTGWGGVWYQAAPAVLTP